MKHIFNANYQVVSELNQNVFDLEEMNEEQSMYSATPEFCQEHGGPITCDILDKVPKDFFTEASDRGLYPNIDVRIHRLYPGNFPAYPGWHCDAQFRETYFGQPRREHTQISNHLICTVSSQHGGVSNTEFIADQVEIDIPDHDLEEGTPFWAQVNLKMEQEHKDVWTWAMPDGSLTRFDCFTLHRCMPARKRGWRLFFRMAMWYRPNLDGGHLSRQEHVYVAMNAPVGW